jgi:hypothetical protein
MKKRREKSAQADAIHCGLWGAREQTEMKM